MCFVGMLCLTKSYPKSYEYDVFCWGVKALDLVEYQKAVLDLWEPPLVPLNPQVFIDTTNFSPKYIADPLSGFTTNQVLSKGVP